MKIAQIMVDGFEDIEAITSIDLLRRASIQIDTISLFNQATIESAHGIKLQCDFMIGEVDLADYDGFILPGGEGHLHYFKSELLKDALINANKSNKMIAAICAAPTYLATIGLLEGKEATIFPDMEEEFAKTDIKLLHNQVVVAKNIITGPAVGNAINFALTIITYLHNQEKSDRIKAEIYY